MLGRLLKLAWYSLILHLMIMIPIYIIITLTLVVLGLIEKADIESLLYIFGGVYLISTLSMMISEYFDV